MSIQPYLSFEGRCEEAIAYYEAKLGAERLDLMRFREAPDPPPPGVMPPGTEDRVMHGRIRIGSTDVMVSDGMCSGRQGGFDGFSLTIMVDTPAEADRLFEALAADGEVRMPIGQTFFSPRFGMVADKFGVGWIIIANP